MSRPPSPTTSGRAAASPGEHRCAQAHRLEDRQADSLVAGGKGEGDGAPHDREQVVPGDESGAPHAPPGARCRRSGRGSGSSDWASPPVSTSTTSCSWAATVANARMQQLVVLVGPRDRRVDEPPPRQAVARLHLPDGHLGAGRLDAPRGRARTRSGAMPNPSDHRATDELARRRAPAGTCGPSAEPVRYRYARFTGVEVGRQVERLQVVDRDDPRGAAGPPAGRLFMWWTRSSPSRWAWLASHVFSAATRSGLRRPVRGTVRVGNPIDQVGVRGGEGVEHVERELDVLGLAIADLAEQRDDGRLAAANGPRDQPQQVAPDPDCAPLSLLRRRPSGSGAAARRRPPPRARLAPREARSSDNHPPAASS